VHRFNGVSQTLWEKKLIDEGEAEVRESKMGSRGTGGDIFGTRRATRLGRARKRCEPRVEQPADSPQKERQVEGKTGNQRRIRRDSEVVQEPTLTREKSP